MRTVLTVDHINKTIQFAKMQRFNGSPRLERITEFEARKLVDNHGHGIFRYTRKYSVLK